MRFADVSTGGLDRMLTEMRDRLKARVGIYGTGWNPESVIGLLLPLLVVIMLAVFGWMLIHVLHAI